MLKKKTVFKTLSKPFSALYRFLLCFGAIKAATRIRLGYSH
jgi:hypothetical protein